MTAKTFVASILCASAILPLPIIAANPDAPKQEVGVFARYQLAVARKAAVTILEELHFLDSALDQWAIENNKRSGALAKPQELAVYVKKGTRLHAELSAGRVNDSLGNPITLRGFDSVPLVSRKTVEQFASAAQPGFWKPFWEGPELSTAPPPEPAPANPTTISELRITCIRLSEEMRELDTAMDQWAIENNKPDGAQARPQDLIPYVKKGGRLHGELVAGRVNDSLGNPITIPPMGTIPTISEATAQRLAKVAPPDFWGPFYKK